MGCGMTLLIVFLIIILLSELGSVFINFIVGFTIFGFILFALLITGFLIYLIKWVKEMLS